MPAHTAAVPLSAVASTLRIPLAARALGDRLFPQLAVDDIHAAKLLSALGDDGQQWLRDRVSVYAVLARTRCLRERAWRFLDKYPHGLIVNLGCGLSDYFQWLDNGQLQMIDADLPEVLALRRDLLPETHSRHHLCALDLTEGDWWEQLGLPTHREGIPVFLFCEGVLMYLDPAHVRTVLRTFGERAPAESTLVFDALCWLAVGQARSHLSVGLTRAEFRWGPWRLQELVAPSPRLQLIASHAVLDTYGWPYNLWGPWFRATFGLPYYAVYELQTQTIRH